MGSWVSRMAVVVLVMIVAGPALVAQERTEAEPIDFGTAEPVPDHPGYEITDDGYLILEGDMITAKCGEVRREESLERDVP